MEGITIGQAAPSFRLPSAQGGEIGLEDYRGQKSVVVWFTKGMGCPFCRSQMTQISRRIPTCKTAGGEVLEIPGFARAPGSHLCGEVRSFPYLCDPTSVGEMGYRITPARCQALRHRSGEGIDNPFRTTTSAFAPPLDEMRRVLNDDDMGLFIVDKQRIVRYATTGAATLAVRRRSRQRRDPARAREAFAWAPVRFTSRGIRRPVSRAANRRGGRQRCKRYESYELGDDATRLDRAVSFCVTPIGQPGRSREQSLSMRHSLCFSVFRGGRRVGLASPTSATSSLRRGDRSNTAREGWVVADALDPRTSAVMRTGCCWSAGRGHSTVGSDSRPTFECMVRRGATA